MVIAVQVRFMRVQLCLYSRNGCVEVGGRNAMMRKFVQPCG